jgi:hypothetical protein
MPRRIALSVFAVALSATSASAADLPVQSRLGEIFSEAPEVRAYAVRPVRKPPPIIPFNLMPVLPFDGGHAVVVIYEWIASKVKHRRVFVDYRKLIPVSVVLLIPILFLGLSSMVLDIRQLGQ